MCQLPSVNSAIKWRMCHSAVCVSASGFVWGLDTDPLSTIWPLWFTVSSTRDYRRIYPQKALFLPSPFDLRRRDREIYAGLSILEETLLNATQLHLISQPSFPPHTARVWSPSACAARPQCRGIITSRQEDWKPRITPRNTQILLDSEPLSQSPPPLFIHSSSLHSSPPDPWAALTLFTPHTQHVLPHPSGILPHSSVCACVCVCVCTVVSRRQRKHWQPQ